jgi:hypothetical protein
VLDAHSAATFLEMSAEKFFGPLWTRNGGSGGAVCHSVETLRALATAEPWEEAVFISRLTCERLEERAPLGNAVGVVCARVNTTLKTAET